MQKFVVFSAIIQFFPWKNFSPNGHPLHFSQKKISKNSFELGTTSGQLLINNLFSFGRISSIPSIANRWTDYHEITTIRSEMWMSSFKMFKATMKKINIKVRHNVNISNM